MNYRANPQTNFRGTNFHGPRTPRTTRVNPEPVHPTMRGPKAFATKAPEFEYTPNYHGCTIDYREQIRRARLQRHHEEPLHEFIDVPRLTAHEVFIYFTSTETYMYQEILTSQLGVSRCPYSRFVVVF